MGGFERMTTRVVVTGIGLITSVGNDTSTTWEALKAGKSGIKRIEHFDLAGQKVTIAGEIRNLDLLRWLSAKEQRRHGRFVSTGIAAAMEAVGNSGLDIRSIGDAVGVLIGSGTGSLEAHEDQHRVLFEKGPERISPFYITQSIVDSVSGAVAIMTGAGGPNYAVVSACATSANALGESFEIIRRGDARAMIAGGVETAVTPIGIAAFANMQALSRRNDEPERASRPFDAQRDGFVMGEGACCLILEDLELARERGATIYGEMVGYGATDDAYHITEPSPGGTGLQRAMRRAIEKAGASLTDVDYINAHGTATPFNDKTETAAIKALFGDHAYKLAISSTKSMIGHTLGAAGAVEAAVTIFSLREGILTPTINLETPDPECDLDYVPNVARKANIHLALSNSMGFGGHNACLAFRKWEE
jgi:3-oxoacyl-[acyl-carrier-protein] synthase II